MMNYLQLIHHLISHVPLYGNDIQPPLAENS